MNRQRTKRPIVLYVLLLLLVTTGFFHATLEVRHRSTDTVFVKAAGEPASIKVMTYNIRHAKGLDGHVDLGAVIKEIVQADPHIVALQEVDRLNVRSGFVDQIARLGEALDMHWAYAPTMGVFVTEYGNAVLSKFPIISSQMFLLPGKSEARNAMQVLVDAYGQPLNIWNTHLGQSSEDRQRQIPVLVELTKESEAPYIVMGDFNMDTAHSALQPSLDSWRHISIEEATHISGKRLDHLFISDEVELIDRGIVKGTASDHFPVIASLRLPDASSGKSLNR